MYFFNTPNIFIANAKRRRKRESLPTSDVDYDFYDGGFIFPDFRPPMKTPIGTQNYVLCLRTLKVL